MDLPQILRTVLAEHEDSGTSGTTLETLQADVEARLSDISSVSCSVNVNWLLGPETEDQIPAYSESSKQLSIVSFRCMLQDTGYPPEVYLPATENAQDGAIDMSQLKERWVGWAVE
jgi:L-alanine-DL-glutamate epimerase-like enolase superfamily enzyme